MPAGAATDHLPVSHKRYRTFVRRRRARSIPCGIINVAQHLGQRFRDTRSAIAAEIIELAEERNAYDGAPRRPNLRVILIEIAQKRVAPPGQLDAIRLGKWLVKHENTIAFGFKTQS